MAHDAADDVVLDDDRPNHRPALSRRRLLGSVGLLGAGGLGLFGGLFTGGAAAHVSSGSLTVAGDSITTDDGQLESLTVTVSSGHVSYDGLDTEAQSIDVALYAAPSGGATDASRNRIASESATVALQSGLKTHAGHYDVDFTDVDVLAADDLAKTDFSAAGDGTTEETVVDLRIALLVKDGEDSVIAEADAVETVSVTVTNEERSSGTQGDGSVDAGGTNQSP